jgi:hypothetical protein
MSVLHTGRILKIVKGGVESEGQAPNVNPRDKVIDVLRGIKTKEDPAHLNKAAEFLKRLEALRNEAA